MARATSNGIVQSNWVGQPRDAVGVVPYHGVPPLSFGRPGEFCFDLDGKRVYLKGASGWTDLGLVKGDRGWVPVIATKNDGVRRVHQIIDYVGGEGDKPTAGDYLSTSGQVSDISAATDIRGPGGPAMLISGLAAASGTANYDTLLPSAEAGGDNQARSVQSVVGAGGHLTFQTVSAAAEVEVLPTIKAVTILSAHILEGGDGHTRRRVSSEPLSGPKHRSADFFNAEGVLDVINGGWWAADTSTVRYWCAPTETRVGSSYDRTWAVCSVPAELNYFSDNADGLQNCTVGGPSGNLAGNAARSYFDNTGVERSAGGYSRNSQTTVSGWYPDVSYREVGNPFTTDEAFSHYVVAVTVKAGSAYWGGAAKSYFAHEINTKTGRHTFRNPHGGADEFNFSDVGTPAHVTTAMSTTRQRGREAISTDHYVSSVNDYAISTPSDIGQDNALLPSWRIGYGGAFYDFYHIERAPEGATSQSQYVSLFKVAPTRVTFGVSAQAPELLVGQTSTSSFADGQLAVTATAAYRTPISAKGAGPAGAPVATLWNPTTSDDAIFISFLTETSPTNRAAIYFNRTGGTMVYGTPSDYRTKDVIGPVTGALDMILATDVHMVRMRGAMIDMPAVIAHQAQTVMPWAVTGAKDDTNEDGTPKIQQVDYSLMVPVLLAAVKELAAVNTELLERIRALETANG